MTRKRDRHGRLIDGEIRTARDFADMLRTPHYAELSDIARAVFLDRNAQGYSEDVRAEIKERARPHFREALAHARRAKAALRRNDLVEYEAERLRACLELQTAAVHFRQEYIDQYRAIQTVKAQAGAAARFPTHSEIRDIIAALARRTDELDDPLPASDLWPDFYSALDKAGLRPDDSSGERVHDDDRMTWDGNDQGMTYKTFRNRISAARS